MELTLHHLPQHSKAHTAQEQPEQRAGHAQQTAFEQEQSVQGGGRAAQGSHQREVVASSSDVVEHRDEDACEAQGHDEHGDGAQRGRPQPKLLRHPVHLNGRKRHLHVRFAQHVGDGQDGERVAFLEQHGRDFPGRRVDHLAFVRVHVPNALHRGQDELVHHASARFEDAHDGEGLVGVDVGLVGEAVRAEKRVAQPHSQILGHPRAQRHLKRRLPELALGQRDSVVFYVAVLGSHDAVAFVVVAVRQRNARGDIRVLDHLLGLALQDVARRCVDVVHVGQDELQRTSLRPEHQINVLDVPLKGVVHLLLREEHEAHHAHSKRQQRQTQGRLQGLSPQVSPRLVEESELHDWALTRVTQFE